MDYIWANFPKICCNFYAFGQVEIYNIFLRGWDFEKNLKNVILCVETTFVRYNYMFLTTPYKILPFSKL